MKLALAQINPTVGDLEGNARKIIYVARRAHNEAAELVVFPELCVTGYPPLDLLEQPVFIEAAQQALRRIAGEVPPEIGVIVGAPLPNDGHVGRRIYNAAILFENGEQKGIARKVLLPTYDVFDEHRYFEPAAEPRIIEWRGLKLGLHVCEDMWNSQQRTAYRLYEKDPVGECVAQGADLLINISASPFSVGKHAERNVLIEDICRRHGVPFVFCNTVGANTEIVFDGDSRVHAADGTLIRCAPSFEEHLLLWDAEADAAPCRIEHPPFRDLHDALVLGIRDYFHKTGVFDKTLVGLSGGIDSAVTCALAVRSLGPERVLGVTMPSRYSSEESMNDSKALADNLGIACHEISIEPAVDAFDAMLANHFAGTEVGVAEENLQARARGVTLMALSNKFGYLVLSTGNKSEMAVGYATLYGDMSGGLAVLADVLKTDVYRLACFINEEAGQPLIPPAILDKPPSAELRPDQTDQDTLPPYQQLDAVLRLYVEEQQELEAISAATGFDEASVAEILRMVDRNEYKRRQAPPGLRVSSKAFGLGRRLPIVMRWERRTAQEAAVPESPRKKSKSLISKS